MKKVILSLAGLCLLAFLAVEVNSLPFVYDKAEITLSTSTATLVSAPRARRNYFLAVNTGSSYDLLLATYSLTGTDTAGLRLFKNGGYWEETYTCYQSSWYAIAKTAPTTIITREKE